VDGRALAWDRSNRKHLTLDHPERAVSISDIEEKYWEIPIATNDTIQHETTTSSSVAPGHVAG
jgi:hypothetical protein